jgi:hypothetical protein
VTINVRGVVAGLGLSLLTLTACGSGNGPALTAPFAPAIQGAARVHDGDTVTIGSMVGCLNKSGSITVDNITPVHPTGLTVTGWAIRPNPFWKAPPPNPAHIGGQIIVARAPLSRLAFPSGHQVNVQCGKNGQGFEFAVQVRKTITGPAGASGWVVTYTSDGKTKKFGFPIAVRLCDQNTAASKACTALKV